MTIWMYRAQCYSRDGLFVVGYTHSLTEEDYAVPEVRKFAERKAQEEIRRMEGVYPDMPIEGKWHKFTPKDDA